MRRYDGGFCPILSLIMCLYVQAPHPVDEALRDEVQVVGSVETFACEPIVLKPRLVEAIFA